MPELDPPEVDAMSDIPAPTTTLALAKPEKLRSNFIHGIKRLPAAFKPV